MSLIWTEKFWWLLYVLLVLKQDTLLLGLLGPTSRTMDLHGVKSLEETLSLYTAEFLCSLDLDLYENLGATVYHLI